MINKETLRVWWIPQVPMEAFYVPVKSVVEGVKIMNVLAEYDAFQYDNNVKDDYSNAGGLEMFDDDDWCDWYIEDDIVGYFDDPDEYLREMK